MITPLGAGERENLFLKYLLLFFITASVFLLALYFTQETHNDLVSDSEKHIYSEFESFDKARPGLVRLIDGVTAEAEKTLTENANGASTLQKANGLINDFDESHKADDVAANPFIKNITDLLRLHINATGEKKANDEEKNTVQKQLDACKGDLRQK